MRNSDTGTGSGNWPRSDDFQLHNTLTSASHNPKFLLVLACSATKRTSPGLLPAIERYDGNSYRVLTKARREGYVSFPATAFPGFGGSSGNDISLDILILSAKYGWLKPTDLIENYDQRMTRARALELQARVSSELDQLLEKTSPHQQIYFNLGQNYQLALATSTQLPFLLQQAGKIVMAQGGSGQRAAHLKSWLHNLNIS